MAIVGCVEDLEAPNSLNEVSVKKNQQPSYDHAAAKEQVDKNRITMKKHVQQQQHLNDIYRCNNVFWTKYFPGLDSLSADCILKW